MTQALSSQWILGQTSSPEATITLRTNKNSDARPISLSFTCSRNIGTLDSRIYQIFLNAVQGKAHLNLTPNTSCAHDDITPGCGNLRGHLAECRCETLDRVQNPEIRTHYENHVISQIFGILNPSNDKAFHLKLALFCSGRLLGEQILLFRLLHQLKVKDASGTVELFFIDTCYEKAIQNSHHTQSFEDSVGREEYIKQFLMEISQCLPQTITVKGTFFGDADLYIQTAKSNPDFKHHLLIGADIGSTNFLMGNIGREAALNPAIKPIALIKTKVLKNEAPFVCQLDSVGNLQNCYRPDQGNNTSTFKRNVPQTQLAVRNPIQFQWPLIFTIGAVVVVIMALYLFQLNKKR